MRVIDSFPQMGRAFERGEFSIAAWRRYAAEISPALPEKLEADAAEHDLAGAVRLAGIRVQIFDQHQLIAGITRILDGGDDIPHHTCQAHRRHPLS